MRPKGFDPTLFADSSSPYIQELAVLHGEETRDPYYYDPRLTGSDEIEYRIALEPEVLARAARVEVELYYQSIPPFYLQERFADASFGPGEKDDIQRPYYLTSHLKVPGARARDGEAVLAGWKLWLGGAGGGVGGRGWAEQPD